MKQMGLEPISSPDTQAKQTPEQPPSPEPPRAVLRRQRPIRILTWLNAICTLVLFVASFGFSEYRGLVLGALFVSCICTLLLAHLPHRLDRTLIESVRMSAYMVCPECGCNLRCLPKQYNCPTCGTPYDAQTLRTQWERWLSSRRAQPVLAPSRRQ